MITNFSHLITVKPFKPATYKPATLSKPASYSFPCRTPIGNANHTYSCSTQAGKFVGVNEKLARCEKGVKSIFYHLPSAFPTRSTDFQIHFSNFF